MGGQLKVNFSRFVSDIFETDGGEVNICLCLNSHVGFCLLCVGEEVTEQVTH